MEDDSAEDAPEDSTKDSDDAAGATGMTSSPGADEGYEYVARGTKRSRAQFTSQPSPETPLPSSQASLPLTRPSPHTGKQEVGAPKQLKPRSKMQEGEQPSSGNEFPSSHCSLAAMMMPSPQVGTQVLGMPAQRNPLSSVQSAEQPSPAYALPSSHCSRASTIVPSPQTVAQRLGVPEQRKPASMTQEAEQPSLGPVLPSSQVSPASRVPFPQVAVPGEEDAEEEDVETNEDEDEESAEIVEEELSLIERMDTSEDTQAQWKQEVPAVVQCSLSSHCSDPRTMPSPQSGAQMVGEPEQRNPTSRVQVAEQPSPEAVLPSSHVSATATIPSPQVETH